MKSKKRRSATLQCPDKPAVSKAPSIKVEKSTFATDWFKTLQDPQFHDVTFIMEDGTRLHGHSVVLCASCPFFEKVLATSSQTDRSEQQDDLSSDDFNAVKMKGVCDVKETKTTFGNHTTVNLSSDIKAETFTKFLEFLYTGKAHLEVSVQDEVLHDLKHMSALFEVPYIAAMCDNIMREEKYLNNNNVAFFNHQRVSRLKSLYFNQSHCADVVFLVDGRRIYAHKVVLATRSDVMAAMFSGHFMEGKSGRRSEIFVPGTSYENFCAFLEYLYTDHAPLKQLSDVIGLLALADEKNQRRLLNLCELYISRVIDKTFQPGVDESDLDVIGLLNTAYRLNANQLVPWCLHFISIHYELFLDRKEFLSLTEEDRAYVEQNRWPPLSYLQSLQAYKRQAAAKERRRKDSCAVT